jgi:hypothetical protein
VEAFDGGENLAFGRMQGSGMMQLSAQPGGINGKFFAPLVTKRSEKSLITSTRCEQWYKKLVEE